MTLTQTIQARIDEMNSEHAWASAQDHEQALLALLRAVEALESLECSPTSYALGCFKCDALREISEMLGAKG